MTVAARDGSATAAVSRAPARRVRSMASPSSSLGNTNLPAGGAVACGRSVGRRRGERRIRPPAVLEAGDQRLCRRAELRAQTVGGGPVLTREAVQGAGLCLTCASAAEGGAAVDPRIVELREHRGKLRRQGDGTRRLECRHPAHRHRLHRSSTAGTVVSGRRRRGAGDRQHPGGRREHGDVHDQVPPPGVHPRYAHAGRPPSDVTRGSDRGVWASSPRARGISDRSSGAPKATKTIVDRSEDRERTASCSESRPGDRSAGATGCQSAGIARRAGPASTTTLAGSSEAPSGAARRLAHAPVSAASAIPMASPATSRRRRKDRGSPCPTRVVIRTSRTPRTSRMTAGAVMVRWAPAPAPAAVVRGRGLPARVRGAAWRARAPG